jgi:photosystem II stability/assembly factor-like uncharacterized protein
MSKKFTHRHPWRLAFLIILIGLLALAIQSSQVFAASSQATTRQNPLTSVRMLDRSNGWALTDSQILKTSDGGVHWRDVTPANTTIARGSKADFMNTNYAWIASTAPDGTINVRRTADGGKHWENSAIHTGYGDDFVQDMPHFLNAKDGWLSIVVTYGMSTGTQNTIYKTVDGGQHWSKLTDFSHIVNGLYVIGTSTGISLKDPQTIWDTEAAFDHNPFNGASTLDHAVASVSHNGGLTWQRQALPTIPGVKNAIYTTTPPVFSGQKGLMPVYARTMAGTNYMDIYRSNDGGAHWYTTDYVSVTANMVNASDLQHIYANTATGRVFATTQGGYNWQQISSTGVIGDLDFVNNTFGVFITATSNQYLLRTYDGGHNWQRINYTIQ